MSATLAIIPAAGHSARMGTPKLALHLGNSSILEHAIRSLHAGGVDQVVVVIGPHVPELIPLAESAGAETCRLAEPTADMRSTVEHGLRWIEERCQPRPETPWLLAPGDHPAFSAQVVRQLLDRFAAEHGDSIIIPTYQGRRGHPCVLAWRDAAGIRTLPADRGINSYLRANTAQTVEMQVDDVGVLVNLNTPEDYERFWRSLPSS